MENNHMATCKVSTCFSYFDGKCMCLTSNRFKGLCPFYKTQETVNAERKSALDRLTNLGIVQSAKAKYGGGYYELY